MEGGNELEVVVDSPWSSLCDHVALALDRTSGQDGGGEELRPGCIVASSATVAASGERGWRRLDQRRELQPAARALGLGAKGEH